MEEWRDISGYEGYYQVSNLGRVKSLAKQIKNSGSYSGIINRSERMLSPTLVGGYLQARLSINGIEKDFKVHRLVAMAFILNNENKEQVNHIDGDKINNITANLEWINNRENASHGHQRRRNKTSRFTGVSKISRNKTKKWHACIHLKGTNKSLGFYLTEEEASQAYLKALKDHDINNKYAKAA